MNIALTCHKGLIGHFLKERLEKDGHKIVLAIDRRANTFLDTLVSLKPKEKIDLFIHAAALCKVNYSIENPQQPLMIMS